MFSRIQSTLSRVALIKQIAVGLIIGVLIAIFAPGAIPAVIPAGFCWRGLWRLICWASVSSGA